MTSYTMSSSTLPHAHSAHKSHSRSRGHSYTNSASLTPAKPAANGSISHSGAPQLNGLPPYGHHASHDRPASADALDVEGYSRARTGFQAPGAKSSRERVPLAPINVSQSWKEGGGGKILMTPGVGTDSMPVKYQLPRYSETGCEHDHDHDHDHGHDHAHPHAHPHAHTHTHAHAHDTGSSEKSIVTRILLDASDSWPLIHAILAEKDSRRIFYFMMYVTPPSICLMP